MATDVVIVGAGLAGLMCAYECASSGRQVTIIYQGELDQSSSFYAQGGIAAACGPEDDPVQHMTDTIMAGDGLCDSRVVQLFCDHAPAFVNQLIDLGVPFDKNEDGSFRLTKEGAHSHARIFHVKDYTGTSIIQTLVDHLKDHPCISWINASLQALLTCSVTQQALGVCVNEQEIFAHHVVLATGGFSNVFSRSTNPKKNIGDGIALAYMAGAQLGDLEFIQFHPTVFCASGHPPLLISEALRGEGAFLVNKNNDRFMHRYHQLADLAPRDVVSRAVIQEPDPKLNIAPLMTTIQDRFPTIFEALIARGFTKDAYEIPIQPLVHYTLGGIVATPNGCTNCKGLYAIGECAVTGFHGANRLASNSLLEAGIMGKRCAMFIASHAPMPVPQHGVTCVSISPLVPQQLQWLGEVSHQALGVIRSKDILLSAIHSIQSHDMARHPLFQFVGAILQSALFRKESRGGHFRSDYPQVVDQNCHSILKKDQELIHVDEFS